MKITVAKSDLEAALSVAKISVSADADLSGHYLFRVKDGKAEILSYHQRIFSRAPLTGATVEGDEGAAFTVEAWRLDKWVGGVTDGVLVLTADGAGEVAASGPRSKIKLRSLDPSKFPFWDKLVASATSSGTTPAAALSRALGVSRWSVSADDTSKPELCQIEAVKGILWATDRRSLSAAEIPGIPNLTIRIPGKDVAAVIKFLNDKNSADGTVEIKESTRTAAEGGGAALFVRTDGSYLGVSRPNTKLPVLKINRDESHAFSVVLDRDELTTAIAVLSAGAPKGYSQISLRCADGVILVSMPSEAGGASDYPLTLSTVDNPDAFSMVFDLSHPYLQGLISTFGLDKIKLGCNKRDGGGYCTFRQYDSDEDEKLISSIQALTEVPIEEIKPEEEDEGKGEKKKSLTLEEYKTLKIQGVQLKGNRYHTLIVWRT